MPVDAERLRAIPLFTDLGQEELDWLAERPVAEGVSVTREVGRDTPSFPRDRK